MLNILILTCIVFVVYEIALDRFYKKDLQEEKLIAYFSNTRMQLMKMLYMQEIAPDSYYFNFMMRATSYSIRTIYYKKEKMSVEQLDCLKNMFDFLNTDKLKNEFKALNSEQKELFGKTAFKIIELYFNEDLSRKIVLKIYLLKISFNILGLLLKLLEKLIDVVNKHKNDDLLYINEIENSYSLSQYAIV